MKKRDDVATLKKTIERNTIVLAVVLTILILGGIYLFSTNAQYGKSISRLEGIQTLEDKGIYQPPIYNPWEEAERRGIMPDPGYGVPFPDVVNGYDNIINDNVVYEDDIINTGEQKYPTILYDPRLYDPRQDYPQLDKPYVPPAPKPQPKEETVPVVRSKTGYTCQYDMNGNFMHAYKLDIRGMPTWYPGRPSDCPEKIEKATPIDKP